MHGAREKLSTRKFCPQDALGPARGSASTPSCTPSLQSGQPGSCTSLSRRICTSISSLRREGGSARPTVLDRNVIVVPPVLPVTSGHFAPPSSSRIAAVCHTAFTARLITAAARTPRRARVRQRGLRCTRRETEWRHRGTSHFDRVRRSRYTVCTPAGEAPRKLAVITHWFSAPAGFCLDCLRRATVRVWAHRA